MPEAAVYVLAGFKSTFKMLPLLQWVSLITVFHHRSPPVGRPAGNEPKGDTERGYTRFVETSGSSTEGGRRRLPGWSDQMASKRTTGTTRRPRNERAYNRFCPLSMALDKIGDRWTIHIIYHLLTGPKRYTDLKDYLAGAGSNVVSDRLRLLAAEGIVERSAGHAPGSQVTYHLTERGWELGPVIRGLALWGLRAMTLATINEPDEVVFDQKWAMGDEKSRAKETFQWTVDGRELSLVVQGHQLTRIRGRAKNPTAVLDISTAVLEQVLNGEFTIPEGAQKGLLRLEGSPEALRRMFWATGFPSYGLGDLVR